MAATDPSQPSIDRLIAQLGESDNPDVAALVRQYQAGTLTLAALVSQAHDAIRSDADDDLDDIEPGQRAGHHVLTYGLLFGALGGLAMLAKPDAAPAIGESSSMFALQAAAAEYGGDVKPAVIAEVRHSLEERLNQVMADQAAGEITDAQASAYVNTILANDAWLSFGTEQNSQAKDAGETLAYWETDSPANGCDDCQGREDASPYDIDDLPGIPGDGSTECGPGCVCSVRYGHAEKSVRVIREAVCVTCGRWVGRNMNADATAFCPHDKATKIRERVTA